MSNNPHKEKNSSSIDGIVPKFALLESHPSYAGVRGSVANPYLKLAGASCFALLIFVQLSNIGSTVSYFSDVESSLGNFFVADPVYFTVEASTTDPIILGSDDVLVVPTMTPGEKADLIQYQVTAKVTGGDSALCSAISVLATEPFPYDGPLTGLTTGLTTESGPWALSFSVPQNSVLNASSSCDVDLVYQGWNASSTPGFGYTDTEKVSLTFLLPAPSLGDSATLTDATTTDASSTPSATPPAATTDDTSTDATSSSAIAVTPASDAATTTATSTVEVSDPVTVIAPPDSAPVDTPPADASSQPPADAPAPADTPPPTPPNDSTSPPADTPSQ